MTNDRWHIAKQGIEWVASAGQPHTDHLEMSGKQVSIMVTYGQDEDNQTVLRRDIVYPLLRTIPNNTHASTICTYGEESRPRFIVNGKPLTEILERVTFDGVLTLYTVDPDHMLSIRHLVYPSPEEAAAYEMIILENLSSESLQVYYSPIEIVSYGRGTKGVYDLRVSCPGLDRKLNPGDTINIACTYSGRISNQPPASCDAMAALNHRCSLIDEWRSTLALETPDPVINQCFSFAKQRACESIFENRCGLLHSPGGGSYYAAVWTNDQVEYAGPFFPFMGYPTSVEASINAYQLYVPFMGDNFYRIPSSIIAEGQDIWEGAGDRGDASMYLYGLSRFLLANGDRTLAREFFPALRWCIEYNRRHMNDSGVIMSDSDELEGRFLSGKANLCTSSLAYGGLMATAAIARELGEYNQEAECLALAKSLRSAIENYFGANVAGFDTYRYYEGNDVLRSWLAIPLTMGIFERRKQTAAALFSPYLWTENGLATQSGDRTFWDRATLYGLRGVFYAGEYTLAGRHFSSYSRMRLLGEHVPYAVEAWPEGNQRHLSAESALYCRVVTEGIFGMIPTGFRSFSLKPSMPEGWPSMSLSHIRAFGSDFSITVNRIPDGYEARIQTLDGRIRTCIISEGSSAEVDL